MEPRNPIETALRALEAGSAARIDGAALDALRRPLGDGERALFDRALALRQGFDELHQRVLRSAVFAEAALGTAAFIHELRQCLSPVMGLAELMKESPGSPFVHEWAAELSAQAMRLADLLDRHAALLRAPSSAEGPCEVAAVAMEASRYFSRLPPGVELWVNLPDPLPPVMARRRQLLHALINLLANARDAHRGHPGTIEVSARVRSGRLELIVSDQGRGVDPAIRHRLFEPLFTTKEEDGTGLGLFLSRELLRPGGELVLLEGRDLPLGAKTAFAIRLPLAAASPRVEAGAGVPVHPGQPEAVESRRSADAGGREAGRQQALARAMALWEEEEEHHPVLLVEDEPAVRRMTRAVLESLAHVRIYEAADAAFALALLEKQRIDLLVCDKNLPDQDGLEVIRRARLRHSAMGAMIVTGYPSPDSAAEAIRVGATGYLIKPVREVKTLREGVAATLLRQRLHRLCERHGEGWRGLCQELLEHAPAGSPLRRATEAMLANLSAGTSPLRATVAVLGEEALAAGLKAVGLDAVAVPSPRELAGVGRELDLLLFSAEGSTEEVERLVAAAHALPCPPHLVGLGRFVHTEAAVAAIRGRTGLLLERSTPIAEYKAALHQATARRRQEVRAWALGRLLRELGVPPEPATVRPGRG